MGDSPAGGPPAGTGTSERLLSRARKGDARALSTLLRRHLPSLQKWAHGRLPGWLRTVSDTSDLVQNAVLHTVRRLHTFEARGEKALGAYLRQAVLNQIRDEHRRLSRRGQHSSASDALPGSNPSPFEEASYAEIEGKYRAALARLKASDQELIVAHVELGYSHEQLACMTHRRRNAARMALRRALDRLANEMRCG